MKKKEMENILAHMDVLYRMNMLENESIARPKNYDGETMTVVEMHTLTMVAEEPGICVSDVAARWRRTLGAASRNVDRLCERGLVEKRKEQGNNKTIHLYPTPRGTQLAETHEAYDVEKKTALIKRLLQTYTYGELMACFSIMKDYSDILQASLDAPKAKEQEA